MRVSILVLMLILVSGCNAQVAPSTNDALTTTVAPVAVVTPSPTVSPTASPSPSPSPSASPTPHTFSGAGTLANPYLVGSSVDVQHLGDFPAAHFKVTNSIDMTGASVTPIANFSGVIQGQNYQLNNLTITGTGTIALVINLTGIINALYTDSIDIVGTTFAAAFAVNVYGTISNCMILSGAITSPQGGNGTTGTGNPFYVNFVSGAVVTADQATVSFNGNNMMGEF